MNSLISDLASVHIGSACVKPDGDLEVEIKGQKITIDQSKFSGYTEATRTAIRDLVKSCVVLNVEIEQYVRAVEANQKLARIPSPVEYRALRNDFKKELSFLLKIVLSNLPEEKARNYIVSSNFVYYEALWETAKRSSGLLSFRK